MARESALYRKTNIKYVRERLGYTQRELGLKLGGKSQKVLSTWESGERAPRTQDLNVISEGFSIQDIRSGEQFRYSIDYLLNLGITGADIEAFRNEPRLKNGEYDDVRIILHNYRRTHNNTELEATRVEVDLSDDERISEILKAAHGYLPIELSTDEGGNGWKVKSIIPFKKGSLNQQIAEFTNANGEKITEYPVVGAGYSFIEGDR